MSRQKILQILAFCYTYFQTDLLIIRTTLLKENCNFYMFRCPRECLECCLTFATELLLLPTVSTPQLLQAKTSLTLHSMTMSMFLHFTNQSINASDFTDLPIEARKHLRLPEPMQF